MSKCDIRFYVDGVYLGTRSWGTVPAAGNLIQFSNKRQTNTFEVAQVVWDGNAPEASAQVDLKWPKVTPLDIDIPKSRPRIPWPEKSEPAAEKPKPMAANPELLADLIIQQIEAKRPAPPVQPAAKSPEPVAAKLDDPDRLLNSAEAAEFCNYSLAHWRRLHRLGEVPKGKRMARRKLAWRLADLRTFVERS